MARAIKRAGVIFLALAIICLLAIGVLIGVSSAKNEGNNSLENNKIKDEVQVTADKSYTISGNCSQLASRWAQIVSESISTNKNIQVVLGNNWIAASNSTYTTAFGTATTYFLNGRIVIPSGAQITLDLNGFKIDRNLSEHIDLGGVFLIGGGTLILKDNKYTANRVLQAYANDHNANLTDFGAGGITGAKSNNSGAAIGMSSGTFIIESGMIYGNSSKLNGGGIYCEGASSITMNGGLIADNIAYNGAAIAHTSSNDITINGGIISRNIANYNGSGIYVHNSNAMLNLNGGIISNNQAVHYGTIFFRGNTFNMSDGEISYNHTSSTGIYVYNDSPNGMIMTGGKIINNTTLQFGAGVFVRSKFEMSGGLITGNCANSSNSTAGQGGGVFTDGPNNLIFKAGAKVYGNYAGFGVTNNVHIRANDGVDGSNYAKIEIGNNLNGSDTKIGVTLRNNDKIVFTTGYSSSGSSLANANNYFFSDVLGGKIVSEGNELKFDAETINMPIDKIYYKIYNGQEQTFEPDGFNKSCMIISENKGAEIGSYTVKIKPIGMYEWSNGGKTELEYNFIITRDSVIGENSDYDYIYKDDENKRQNYTDNKIYHKYNDNVLNLVADNPRYVIGNITSNTSVREFITNLKSEDITKVKLFDNNGTLIYNGTTQSSSYDIDSTLVQTGWYLQYESYFANTETIYLSVLGDVIADGVINTLDVTFVNRIARGEIKLDTLSIEQQLAAMVDNKGKVTSTDGKILLNVIGGNTETNSYFENVAQKDKYQLWVLNNDVENNKTYRENINLTTLNIFDNAIIGNIAPNTKAIDFTTKLANQTSANINDIAIHKANGTIAADNDYIGTGCYITYNGKTIYLSVLGDLTGDGRVDTTDMTYLNRIVNGNVNLNTNVMEQKLIMLAAIIQNKGNITTADSESIWNYIGGNIDMSKYF